MFQTLWAGRSRSLFSLMTFHICCALNENPEAGTTPRLSPASPPGAIEWKKRCLRLATFRKKTYNYFLFFMWKKHPFFHIPHERAQPFNIKPIPWKNSNKNTNLFFKLFFLLFITRESHNLNLSFNYLTKRSPLSFKFFTQLQSKVKIY